MGTIGALARDYARVASLDLRPRCFESPGQFLRQGSCLTRRVVHIAETLPTACRSGMESKPVLASKPRSLNRVLFDLVRKLEQLPAWHPDRPSLVRMIAGLRAEIARREDPRN